MAVLKKQIKDTAKIWIYQSNKSLKDIKTPIENLLRGFVNNWQSHGADLDAQAWIEYDRFIVFAVDESQHEASGCSVDSSVHFIKKIEVQFDLDLFDKMNFAYLDDNKKVNVVSVQDFSALALNNEITEDTLVFDNLVKDYNSFTSEWIKPVKYSWHKRFM